MAPLVTISVPIFKCEDFIEKTLASVRLQTYAAIEVILVNDLTPDRSAEIAADFIKKHALNHWKLVSLEKNSGLSVVRNKGLELANGKYLFFVDSDDELVPDAIENLVALAEKTGAEMVMGEVEGIKLPEGTRTNLFPIRCKKEVLNGNDDVLYQFVNGGFAVSSWNKLILTDFLRNNQLYFTAGLYAQDALHSFEMALHLQSVAFLRKVTYLYYLHGNSVIHNRKKIHFDHWITIARKLDEHYQQEKNPQRKALILQYLVTFKTQTLQMNWKAQKNEDLWKRSYSEYAKLHGLGLSDYFSGRFSNDLKKKNFLISLPVGLGYKIFKWRYER